VSVLSSTQGTPDRVWSLLSLLRVHAAPMSRSEARAWLDPGFKDHGREVRASPSAYAQTQGAASSLGLVALDNDTLNLMAQIETYGDFADQTHDLLIALPHTHPDTLLLDMYAWLVLALEAEPSLPMDRNSIADRSNKDRSVNKEAGGDFEFNRDKYKAWRAWMEFLGLGLDLPEAGGEAFFAHPSERLSRVLHRADLPRNQEIPAAEVLTLIKTQMPYLDGGLLFRDLQSHMGVAIPSSTLSKVLSRALLSLKQNNEIEFIRVGDAGNVIHLQVDDRANAFQALVLKEDAQ
jgi:hypothetical protein